MDFYILSFDKTSSVEAKKNVCSRCGINKKLVHATYNKTEPDHFGDATIATITVKGPTFLVIHEVTEKGISFRPLGLIRNDLDTLYFSGGHPDFDFRTADPPVLHDDMCTDLLSSWEVSSIRIRKGPLYTGIVLQKTDFGQFEQISTLKVQRKLWCMEEREVSEAWFVDDFVVRLPVRQLTIV